MSSSQFSFLIDVKVYALISFCVNMVLIYWQNSISSRKGSSESLQIRSDDKTITNECFEEHYYWGDYFIRDLPENCGMFIQDELSTVPMR
jgi:hypothetical protein